MILVDTSIWIDHLRKTEGYLVRLLDTQQVMAHEFVLGELAMGQFKNQESLLDALQEMPRATVAETTEVLGFIRAHDLAGSGIGFVGAHLLASVVLTPGTLLWTRDKGLHAASVRLALDAKLSH